MKNKKLYVFVTISLLVICFIGVVVVIKTQNNPTRPFKEISKNNKQDLAKASDPINKIYDKVLGLSDVATTVQQENPNLPANDDNPTDIKSEKSSSDTSSNSSDKNNQDDNKDEDGQNDKSTDSSSNTPTPTPDLFAQKLTYISTTVDKNKYPVISDPDPQSTPSSNYTDQQITQIFLPDLVDFFGTEEMKKTFENVVKINFTNSQINGDEATTIAVLQLSDNTIKTYKTYFYLKNGDWYLYKTEQL